MPVNYAAAVLLLLLLGLCAAATAPAQADGTVVRANGCGDYIFVSTPTGYSELHGDTEGIKDGDTLQGNVEQIGSPLLYDATAGRSVFAQVAELHLDHSSLAQREAIRCRSPAGETPVFGYVTRTTGCGSKIFVETPQGYAVLERIAGGIVADGDTLTGNFDRPGRATVQDRQSASTLIVFVDDLWLPASAAEREIARSCRRQTSYGR